MCRDIHNVKKIVYFCIKSLKTFKKKQILLHSDKTSIFDTKNNYFRGNHEYANKPICIKLLQFKEQFMRFHFIPFRLF
jgi:hypothetical protein